MEKGGNLRVYLCGCYMSSREGEGGVKISEIVAEEDKKTGKVLERERERERSCLLGGFPISAASSSFFFVLLCLLQPAATETECVFLLAYYQLPLLSLLILK